MTARGIQELTTEIKDPPDGGGMKITDEMIEAAASAIDLYIGPGSEGCDDAIMIARLALHAGLGKRRQLVCSLK